MSRLALACLLCLMTAGIGLLAGDLAEKGPVMRFRVAEAERVSGMSAAASWPVSAAEATGRLPPAEIPAGAAAAVVRGRVLQWRRCPAGMILGMRLDEGTEVRFPPSPADPLAELAPPEEPVEIIGWRFPHDPVLHARWIRNPRTADAAEVDLPPL
ncbi:MAG: hypothetical protein ACK6D3_26310 [Planctomycetaceae bacterium]|jgi:hypothetical protein